MAIVPRLLYFAIERAAEPVSNRLETAAASSPLFQSVCKSIAQAVANVEHNKNMRRIIHDQKMANMQEDATLGKPGSSAWQPADDLEPPPMLDEREATQRGCELLGEGFVLFVGLSLLLHQAASDRADEARQEALTAANEKRIGDLESSLASLDQRVAILEAAAARSRACSSRSSCESSDPAAGDRDGNGKRTSWARLWGLV